MIMKNENYKRNELLDISFIELIIIQAIWLQANLVASLSKMKQKGET